MNSIDIIVLVTMLVFSALGMYWGLIRQVLAVAGLIAGIVLASRYGAVVAESLLAFFRSDTLANTVGFIIVLAAVSSIASLLATLLHRFVGLLFLGCLDHVAGALLGLLQAALLCTVLVAVAATFPNAIWVDALRDSQFAAALVRLFDGVLTLLPDQYQFATDLMFNLP